MSFYGPKSRFFKSSEANVAPGAVISAEGQALVRVSGNTAAGVQPSAGAATDIFEGFSIAGTSAAPFPEAYTNKVEAFIVPSTGIVTLARTPVSGQVGIFDNTAATAVVVTGGVAVTGASISGLTAGNAVTVTYKYAMTVFEARSQLGDVNPGGYSGAYVGQIGVAEEGVIYTTEFDASINWAAVTTIKTGANGQLVGSGNGVTLKAVVVSLPSQEQPYLGLKFSA